MLLYLYGHNVPDVGDDMNFFARYMFITISSHELTLNILASYLNHMKYCGLILDPNYDVCKVDAYLDVDFSWMYGHKNPTDHVCVKICTRFIITFADCPALWVSRLHTNTALSTM